jgi:subtilisin family serine protease
MRTPTASSRFLTRLVAGLAATGLATLTATTFTTTTASAAPTAEGTIVAANTTGAIKDRYIVTLNDGAAPGTAKDLAARYNGTITAEYTTAVNGFTVTLTEKGAKRLAAHPAVATVEQDRTIAAADTQNAATWGIDRIDQRNLPLTGTYTYPTTAAANVTAYILDTGIRLTHTEFEGRARSGYDFIDKDTDASDCQGHGTHVAGTVAGKTHGVAKKAKIVSVRVLDCNGSGSYSAIIAGVDWVTKNATKPAVANMSLGGSTSATLDTAVKNSIAAGITYAVAAGNETKDACTVSPARQPDAITVAATDTNDARATYSNYGTCVDIFAPGSNILSATKTGDTTTGKMSGTSMATPHIAGVAALYLATNPTWTPTQVRTAMINDATPNKITDTKNTPNKLTYTGNITTTNTTPTPTTPAPKTTPAGTTVTVTNATDYKIADRATVDSPLTVANAAGNGSKTTQIKLSVKHADRGDLAVYLIAPDGTQLKLKSATSGDDVRDLNATWTVNLSSKVRNGVWKLRVQDVFAGDTGTIDTWTLTV